MKRNMLIWQFVGFVAVSVLGTLLHFLYGLTGSRAVALFSSVNESTWEHMKLMYFPMLAFTIVQSFYIGKNYENFWCVKFKGILIGLILIPVCFYTIRGVFGTTPDWVNIAIFFLCVAIAFIYETLQFNAGSIPCKASDLAFAAICLIAVAFWVFTFWPPQISLFKNPIDGSYGLVA